MSDQLETLLRYRRQAVRAQTDLIEFIRFMRPVPDDPDDVSKSLYEPAKHHRAVAAALEQVAIGAIPRLILVLPPRHGKTTLASHAFPAFFMGNYPTKSMILATYNEKFSWDFGRQVRDIMTNPRYNQVFPKTLLKSNAAAVDRLENTLGGTLFFTGRGSSITGRGGDILLLDDPIKDRKEADSPTIRDQLWNWYTQVMGTRLMTERGAIVIIMTRWHEDDIVGRLTDPMNPFYNEDEAKKWKIIDLPALARANDVLGRAEGEALWPERFSVPYLLNQKAMDVRGFQALYQGTPAPEDGAFFRASHIRTYSPQELPAKELLRFYCASDHAVSIHQDRDKTCLIAAGVDGDDNIWIMPDVFWDRVATDRAVEAMITLMRRYKPLYWWAERGHISKSIGPFLRKRMIELNTYCVIDEIVPVADKQTRAQPIQARMSMGKVYFPKYTKWWPEAHDQILKFPQGTYDDFIDALAYIGMGMNKQIPRRAAKPIAPEAKMYTLGWLKGETQRDERQQALEKELRGW